MSTRIRLFPKVRKEMGTNETPKGTRVGFAMDRKLGRRPLRVGEIRARGWKRAEA
jgi:hypothetical protein